MSRSTYVVGFLPPDEKWQRMSAVWEACAAAGIGVPGEVLDFFEGMPPDPLGLEIDLRSKSPVTAWENPSINAEGFEVDLDRLDPKIRHLRFYNSW